MDAQDHTSEAQGHQSLGHQSLDHAPTHESLFGDGPPSQTSRTASANGADTEEFVRLQAATNLGEPTAERVSPLPDLISNHEPDNGDDDQASQPSSMRDDILDLDVDVDDVLNELNVDDELLELRATDEEFNIPIKPWDLRATTLDGKHDIGGVWDDRDESGNYDPSGEDTDASKTLLKRKRTCLDANARARATGDAVSRPPKPTSWLSARQNGVGCVVTLKLGTAEGKELAKEIPDNWPEDAWNTLDGNVVPPFAYNNGADTGPATGESSSSYGLRRRVLGDDLDKDEIQDFTGHPEGRGCKECYKIRAPCSMRDHDGSYPCQSCEEEGFECELLVPPKRKQACETCKKRRKHCSYDDEGGDHSLPCSQCVQSDSYCVAGPAYDKNRARIRDDGLPGMPYGSELRRKYKKSRAEGSTRKPNLACSACKALGKKCPVRGGLVSWPCLSCEENETACLFEDTDAERAAVAIGVDSRLLALRNSAAAFRIKLASTSAGALPPTQLARGTETIQISTMLAHPVRFNTAPHSLFKPCHWHLTPTFGLHGLGPPPTQDASSPLVVAPLPTTTVIPIPGSLGFREISGGHTTTSRLLSNRMCKECTMSRVLICACPRHHLQPISPAHAILVKQARDEDMSPEDTARMKEQQRKEWHAAYRALEATKTGTTEFHTETNRWCALCPQLAMYECKNRLAASMNSTSTTNSIGKGKGKDKASSWPSKSASAPAGCGLRLCEPCFVLTDDQEGDLNNVIEQLKWVFGPIAGAEDPSEEATNNMHQHRVGLYPAGLRADYDVYGEAGGMMAQVLQGM